MAKIVLGNRPKSFKRKVTVKMLDGTTGVIHVDFKYRTRKEFGAFVDEFNKARAERRIIAEREEFSNEQQFALGAEDDADYILAIVDGWDLDQELSRENVMQLLDELPGAGVEIISTYRLAVVDGIVKN